MGFFYKAPNTTTSVGGIVFDFLAMNASGVRDYMLDEWVALSESDSGAIVLKSCTYEPRMGNPEPRYYFENNSSINSNGLQNMGHKETAYAIEKLKQHSKKTVIASIAGFTLEEFVEMCTGLSMHADMLEVNLSCPNVNKPQLAYDINGSYKVLSSIRKTTSKPIGVKLPAYPDQFQRKGISKVLLDTEMDFVTLINSPGNALFIDLENECSRIKPNNGMGGLGGTAIKQIALGNVWGFYNLLEGKIPIIGVGGISTGRDIYEFVLAGASAVQVGTALLEEDLQIFTRLKKELADVCIQKQCHDIKDKIGKLKTT